MRSWNVQNNVPLTGARQGTVTAVMSLPERRSEEEVLVFKGVSTLVAGSIRLTENGYALPCAFT